MSAKLRHYERRIFSAVRFEPGLYLQPDDYGVHRYVVARYYGQWYWGDVPRSELERLTTLSAIEAVDALHNLVEWGPLPSKAAAIDEALSTQRGQEVRA